MTDLSMKYLGMNLSGPIVVAARRCRSRLTTFGAWKIRRLGHRADFAF